MALAMTTACADAPITAAQLQDDGQLRAGHAANQEGSVALFAAESKTDTHEARPVALSALLDTSVVENPTEPLRRGETRERDVSLRLKGEGLQGPLPVAIVWTHGDERREQTAVVQPELDLVVAAKQEFDDPSADGAWRVEVYALRAGDRDLMLAREFELTSLDPES